MRAGTLCMVTLMVGLLAGCATQEPVATPEDTALAAAVEPGGSPTPADIGAATSTATEGPITVDRGSGDVAPDFELVSLKGDPLSLSDLRGKTVVLNFWASWCVPCRWEMPFFEAMWREYEDQGIVFVGVAVSDMEEEAREFAEETGVTYPLALDTTGDVTKDYRVRSLPTTYVIDHEGREVRRFGTANEAVLRIVLRGFLAGG